jgi:Family of unknown function (DUF6496)
MAKKPSKAQQKVTNVMREYKAGTLRSGGTGKANPRVKSRKQAIAIALSEAGKTRKPRCRACK